MTGIEAIRPPEIQALLEPGKNSNSNLREETNKIARSSPDPVNPVNYQDKAQQGRNGTESNKNEPLPDSELQQRIEDTNAILRDITKKELSFFVDEETGRQGVRIIDSETKEVLKQIPRESMLKLAARIKKQVGAFIDEFI